MKNYKLYLIGTVLLFLLFNSCCKEVSCPDISTDERAWIPYQNYDTLVFKNFENDSILKISISNYGEKELIQKEDSYVCKTGCLYGIGVTLRSVNTDNYFRYHYVVEKSPSTLYVFCDNGGFTSQIDDVVSRYSIFDLRGANKLDTVETEQNIYFDVYIFKTNENYINDIFRTYIKKGVGIIKLDMYDGQSFELIDYKKNEGYYY